MEATFKIGVMGSAEGTDTRQESLAGAIGEAIASYGCIIITGACPGLPHRAALAAASQGGICLGFSPAINLREHTGVYQFPAEPYILVFTGMGKKGRNVISIRSCDAVILVGGRIGTLNEFTIAFDEGKIIGILEDSGGLSNRFFELAKESGKKTQAIIVRAKDPLELIKRVIEALTSRLG